MVIPLKVDLKSQCFERSKIGASIKHREIRVMTKDLIVGFNGRRGAIKVTQEKKEREEK
jgi:hypothetical protein